MFVVCAEGAKAEPRRGDGDTEFVIVPVAGGNSDIGFGGGYLISWARKRPDLKPYEFGIESAGAITFRPTGDGLEVPYVDDYVRVAFPHLVRDRLGLELRLSYTREYTLKYFGLGNASVIPAGRELTDDYFEYSHTHPAIQASLRRHLFSSLWLGVGLFYSHNWVAVPHESLLAADRQRPGKHGQLLRSEGNHGAAEFSYGVEWDTRDNDVSPRRGQHHKARIDLAPGGPHPLPYRYARINTSFIFFQELYPKRLVLALRAAGDALMGDVPFYELARFDRTFFGGGEGVRGVPAQRYYGKLKLLGNAELRTRLFDVTVFGKPYGLGVIGIFDAGRVFTGYERTPELDGTGLGLKYGLGAGLRVHAGTTFVLRGDAAWSPDADPVGLYIAGGHVF
jgi:outer membrane protein assembly factor BamA